MIADLGLVIRRRLHAFWRQARMLPAAEENRAVEIELAIIAAHVEAALTHAGQKEDQRGRAA